MLTTQQYSIVPTVTPMNVLLLPPISLKQPYLYNNPNQILFVIK